MTSETTYQSRTDSFDEKIHLLKSAYESGKLEFAMSLAESIKDTLILERQMGDATSLTPPTLRTEDFGETEELPSQWAEWARGWRFYKVVAFDEPVGLPRSDEPAELIVSFNADQISTPMREVRIARIDDNAGILTEVPCQVYNEVRRGAEHVCQILFLADVAANGRTTYLIFYGNPYAELPNYQTDLKVSGEGFGLDIENGHYIAKLSRQMGQLERLIYKQAHGLELFAGGEGHGEPPGIDWAHDYVSAEGFQKFRVTNWEQPPNYEVIKGPLCVKVRRWGFPHSTVHPLYLPTRMHIDVTYTFYANAPYFEKQSRMDIIKPLEITYLRDDEWVFSGYSFTDCVWMGSDGILHEGEVPGDQANDLWAVGFYHRQSRDAFIALRLSHAAKNFEGGFYHSGVPVLDYKGHGQLWSRWAVHNAQFEAGASLQQHNAYLVSAYPAEGGEEAVQKCREKLLNPLVAGKADAPIEWASSTCYSSLARRGERNEGQVDKDAVWEALRDCKDDQLYQVDANVVDMGLIYDVRIQGDHVQIVMTMPHHGRPKYGFIANPIRERLLQLDGVREVAITNVWEPAWSVHRLTDTAREMLDLPQA